MGLKNKHFMIGFWTLTLVPLSIVLMFIGIWFTPNILMMIVGCSIPVFMTVSIILFIRSFQTHRNRCLTMQFVGLIVFVLGYIYILIELIVNEFIEDKRVYKTGKVLLWISEGLIIFLIIFSSCLLIEWKCKCKCKNQYRDPFEKTHQKDLNKILDSCYNPNKDILKMIEMCHSPAFIKNALRTTPISKKEADTILRLYKSKKKGSELEDSSDISCSLCNIDMKDSEEYIKIHECDHIVCGKCVREIVTDYKILQGKCGVCSNDIRIATIAMVHNIPISSFLDIDIRL